MIYVDILRDTEKQCITRRYHLLESKIMGGWWYVCFFSGKFPWSWC